MNASSVVSLSSTEAQNPLQDVQKRFALLDLAGTFYILKKQQIRELLQGRGGLSLSYYKEKEGKLVIRRHLEAQAYGLNDKEVTILLFNFMKSPNTHVYTSVAFDPSPQPNEVLNLWRPHAVQPEPGDFELIRRFLCDIICNGDRGNYHYLVNYLAHMLQRPEEKPMVAVILLGGQGIGKGALYTLIKTIWPYTVTQVHSIDQVLGRFTAAALEQSLGVWMDEALFSGDKKSSDRLKALITEDRITIEEKFQPAKTMKSFHRLFAASNHEHFAPTDRDDRRFFFLRVNESWKQNADKFGPLFASYSDGQTVPAFVHYLLNLDISSFNPAVNRPKTTEHANQTILSLEGLDRFLYEVLQAAEIPESRQIYGRSAKVWGDELIIATEDLRDAIREADKSAERYKPISSARLKPAIMKIFPSAKKDERFQEGGKSRRGVWLPDIHRARKDFERHIGCSIAWEPVDE
jgi:hypothetical protein